MTVSRDRSIENDSGLVEVRHARLCRRAEPVDKQVHALRRCEVHGLFVRCPLEDTVEPSAGRAITWNPHRLSAGQRHDGHSVAVVLRHHAECPIASRGQRRTLEPLDDTLRRPPYARHTPE